MHLFKQHAVKNSEAASRLITVSDYGPNVAGGNYPINLGNIVRRCSNGRFLSTPPAVIDETHTDRYSIAYYNSSNPVSVIECMPDGEPARYPPAVHRDLVLEFYRNIFFHQKGHESEAVKSAGAV